MLRFCQKPLLTVRWTHGQNTRKASEIPCPLCIPVAVRMVKPIEARLKAVLARLGTMSRRLSPKPRSIPALKTPSFEQVMHAELAAAVTTASAPRSSGSRLSEIRNRLQAE